MSKKNKRKNDSLEDHIFAALAVFLMCVFILFLPFFIFFGVIQLIALTPYISLQTNHFFGSILVILKFFVLTAVVIGTVDVAFSQILVKKKGAFHFIMEALLLFCILYLYILIYSLNAQEIMITDKGVFIVTLFLFLFYLSIHAIYVVSRWLHRLTIKNIQKKNNLRTKRKENEFE